MTNCRVSSDGSQLADAMEHDMALDSKQVNKQPDIRPRHALHQLHFLPPTRTNRHNVVTIYNIRLESISDRSLNNSWPFVIPDSRCWLTPSTHNAMVTRRLLPLVYIKHSVAQIKR